MSRGKYIRTEEHRKKSREINKGNSYYKLRKKNGRDKGFKVSEETKQKISNSTKGISRNVGDKNPMKKLENRKKVSETLKRKYKEGLIKSSFQNKEFQKSLKHSERMKNGGALKALAGVKKIRSNTIIEQKMEAILQDLELKYIKQFRVEKYTCDFYLPEYNLIIECDGEYWHHYPNYKEKDIIRDYFLMSKGFFGLRFWGKEIENKEKCRLYVMKTLYQIRNYNCICGGKNVNTLL